MANKGFNSREIRDALAARGALPADYKSPPPPAKGEAPDLERAWLDAWTLLGHPAPVAQFQFHPTRKWAFDFCWPGSLVALEVMGGGWGRGRHHRPKGYAADAEKLWEAQKLGWIVRYVTDVKDTRLMADVAAQIERRKGLALA